jgi:hypothetical protein
MNISLSFPGYSRFPRKEFYAYMLEDLGIELRDNVCVHISLIN